MGSVEIARAQAMAYVWGRQDAGESERDTGFSMAFAAAVAMVRELYETERTWCHRPLQDQFPEWRDTRMIRVSLSGDQYGTAWAVWSPDDFASPVLVPIPSTTDR